MALALFLLVSPAHAQDDQSFGQPTVVGQPATDESPYPATPGDYNPGWQTATVPVSMNGEAPGYLSNLWNSAIGPLGTSGTPGVGPNDTANNSYATWITPEIQSLATSLNNDPRLMYEYVLNNIDFVPYLGSMKGATLTYLDRSGNDYDQASLLIALLQAAGYSTATYNSGEINYPIFNGTNNYDVQHWLGGTTDQSSTTESAIVNIFGNAGYNVSGKWYSNHTLTLDRIWVQVTVNGTTYQLDPAFKRYNTDMGVSPASITSAAGYSRSDIMGAAGGGSDPTTAQNMSESGIDGKLNGYVTNLTNYLNSNYSNNSMSDIVTGRAIIWEDTPRLTTAIRFFSVLPADTTVNYYHTVTINHGGIVNQILTLPTVAARRLAMVYDQPVCTETGISTYGSGWNFGSVCPGSPVQLGLSWGVPQPATFTFQVLNGPNGVFKFSDGSTSKQVASSNGSVSITLEVWGSDQGTPVGTNMTATLQMSAPGYQTSTFPLEVTVAPMAKATLLLDDSTVAAETSGSGDNTIKIQVTHPYVTTIFNDANPLSYPVVRGGTYVFASEFGGSQSGQALSRTQKRLAGMLAGSISGTSEQETIETLNVIGQTWLRQTTLNTALGAWATNTRYTVHHRIGLAGVNTSFYVDIRNQMGSATGYNGSVGSGLMTKICGLVPSSLEHGVLEQLQFGTTAVSTVKILELANTGAQKVFMTNSSNWSTVQPQLTGYSSNDLSTFSSDIGNGYVLFLPQNGSNVINQWKGEGYIAYYDSGNYSSIMMAIGGGYNGGFITENNTPPSPPVINTQSIPTITAPTTNFSDPNTHEPIDLATGAYTLDHADLKLGSTAPLGLALGRSYTSQNSTQQTAIGNGWRHSFDISLSTYSDGATPLGLRRHVDAAPAIVSALVIADLMQDISGTDPATAQKWLGGALTAKWLTDNLLNHAVSIYYGEKVMNFTQLPNGTYISPPGITSTLVNSSGVYKLQNRDGSTLAFTSVGTNDYRASSLTDANGNVMSFTYNGNLLSKVTDAFGRTLTFTYSGNLLTSVLDSNGRTVKYGYDGSGNLTGYTYADSNLWQYGYGAGLGLLTTLTDPLSQTYITNSFDSQRKAYKQVALRQNNQSASYNVLVNDYRSEEIGPYADAAVYFYDRKGRTVMTGRSLSGSTNVDNRTSLVYDGQDHTTASTDPDNNTTNFIFDGNNNLWKTTDPLNNTTVNAYDPSLFRLTGVADALSHSVSYGYTRFGASLFGDPNHDQSFEYSFHNHLCSLRRTKKGLVSSSIDGRNTTTSLNYILSGGWISGINSTTGSHPAVQKTMDQVGRMTQLVDQKGSIYKLGYNNRDLVTSATDPFNKTASSFYRADGRLDHTVDRNGTTTTFGYTPSGKVQSIAFPGSLNVGFTYDLDDKLTNMTDSMGGATYGYDGYNRLNSVKDAQGSTVGYSYDAASNLKKITYPDGKTVTYSYDALNRLQTVSIDWLSEVATYIYDSAGRLTGISQFNGTIVTPGYDNANRLTSLTNYAGGSIVTGYTYTLDNNGNRTTINATGALPPANVAQNISYTYSPTGNRLTNLGSTTLSYDNDGQLQSNGTTSATYDGAHRLTAYGTSTFYYDGANHRLKATRAGVTKKYVYDASGNLLVEEDGNGNILKYFIYGKGLLAWYDATAKALYCYHFDGNGNTVAVTDMNQKVVNKYSYSPYGVVEGKFEMQPQPFTYVGQFGVMDEGSGIYYMRARYFDANAKRFISEDPMGTDGGDTNLYVYAQNNPMIGIDPEGLTNWVMIGGGAMALANGVGQMFAGGYLCAVGVAEAESVVLAPLVIHTVGLGGTLIAAGAVTGGIGVNLIIQGWNDNSVQTNMFPVMPGAAGAGLINSATPVGTNVTPEVIGSLSNTTAAPSK